MTGHTPPPSLRATIAQLDRDTLRAVAMAYRTQRQAGESDHPAYEAAVAELHDRAPGSDRPGGARGGIADHRPGRHRGAGVVLGAGRITAGRRPGRRDEAARAPPCTPVLFGAGPAYVVAGDTLEVAGERIRLWGIDAVESDQICHFPAVTFSDVEGGVDPTAALFGRD